MPKSKKPASPTSSSSASDSDSDSVTADDDEDSLGSVSNESKISKASSVDKNGRDIAIAEPTEPSVKAKRKKVIESDTEDEFIEASPKNQNVNGKKSPTNNESSFKKAKLSILSKPADTTSKPADTTTKATTTSSSSSSSSSKPTKLINVSSLQLPDITKGPPLSTDKAAKKLISDYMLQQNRPFSVIQVFDNLHKRIQKPSVQRIMDDLVASNLLNSKIYGKNSIYFPNQANLNVTPKELNVLEGEVKSIHESTTALANEEKLLIQQIQNLENQPKDDELQPEMLKLQEIVSTKESRLNAMSSIKIEPGAIETAITNHNHYLKEWKLRKSRSMGFVSDLAESMEKKKDVVIEMLGIETDEEAGINQMPSFLST